MYSKIALASSMRVFQRRRLRTSTCRRAQKASATALSYGSPTVPSEGSRPARRARSVKAHELRAVIAMNKSAEDLGIGRQVRSRPGVDGPANDAAAEGVNHNAAIELALAGVNEFSVPASATVGAVRRGLDRRDAVGQSDMPDCSGRRRAGAPL
jgi:hypothetical protein